MHISASIMARKFYFYFYKLKFDLSNLVHNIPSLCFFRHMLKKYLFPLFVFLLCTSHVWGATLYFNGAQNGNWSNLGNWWQDSGFTTPAVAVPSP